MVASSELCITVNGTEVWLQGQGDEVVLMLHGWPDTRALWDGTVTALQDRATCASLTLPGFEAGPSATSLDDMCQLLRQIVDRISPERPVTLMLHDWGCIFGYEFAMRHPERVARVVAVDVGDHNSGALLRSWGVKEKLSVMGYQVWLALAWKLGGLLGTPGHGPLAALPDRPCQHHPQDELPLCHAVVWHGGWFQSGFASHVTDATAVCLRRTQALHVPFGQVAGQGGRNTRQRGAGPTLRALGDDFTARSFSGLRAGMVVA